MLIGFALLKTGKKPDYEKYFPQEIKTLSAHFDSHTLYLYGYGNEFDSDIKFNNVYKLYDGSLNQRNFHINITPTSVEFKSDWLGSFPAYYDEKRQEVTSHWDMLEIQETENDDIGHYVLKKYSFIPNNRTLKTGIKRLLANECLRWSNEGLCLTHEPTILYKVNDANTEKIIEHITQNLISHAVEKKKGILPLSGGYDSRFLASILHHQLKANFESYTYSLLGAEGECFESKVSKAVAEKMGSAWTLFDLTGYAEFEKQIIDWSGGFSHVNGDYYEMFAEKVHSQKKYEKDHYLLISGIVGDAWAGNITLEYSTPLNIADILYSHGTKLYDWMLTDSEKKIADSAEKELSHFFRLRICDEETMLVELVRAKVPLLSFLCYAFEKRNIPCSAPFLDKTIVEDMLSLPKQEKNQRKWQRNYFKTLGISDENLPRIILKINKLAINEALNKKIPSHHFGLSKSKIRFINIIFSKHMRFIESKFAKNKFTEFALRKIGYKRTDTLMSILKVISK